MLYFMYAQIFEMAILIFFGLKTHILVNLLSCSVHQSSCIVLQTLLYFLLRAAVLNI